MKKLLSFFLVAVLVSPLVFAEETSATEPATEAPATETVEVVETVTTTQPQKSERFGYKEKTWFLQVGGNVGYELDFFENIGGGLSLGTGYHWTDRVATYMRSDVYLHTQNSAYHWNITFLPSFRYVFVDNFYGYFGMGMNVMHARDGSQITGTARNLNKTYANFTTEAGAGYTYFFNKNLGLWSEAGINYTYFRTSNFPRHNLLRPNLRLGVSYQF